MQTRVAGRVLAAVAASGLLSLSACSSGGGPAKPAAVIKASDIDAGIKQYVVTHNDQPVQKICEKLFPDTPTDIVGTDSPYGGVTTDIESMSTSLSLGCEFLGTDCDVSFAIATTSSGSVSPQGLTPKNGHYLDSADGNGVQVDEEVGSDTSSATGCTISIATGRTSIAYLNNVIARVSDN